MSDIFKKIISFFFKKGTVRAKNLAYMASNTSGKSIITAHENMELNLAHDKQVYYAELEIEDLIRTNFNNPENLYSLIRTSGTKIYKVNFLIPILNHLKIQMGYISVLTGVKAGILNLILNKKVDFELRDVFLTSSTAEKPLTFFYKFYMWYFYKNNLLYIDEKIASLLFELDNEDKRGKIPTLTYQESDILSKIIKTDMHAIEFVMNIADSLAKAKSLAKKGDNNETLEN